MNEKQARRLQVGDRLIDTSDDVIGIVSKVEGENIYVSWKDGAETCEHPDFGMEDFELL